nr:hypothetical protein [Methylomarinum sp. Ch1-1]MDP4519504.1 hypothetical protein [Methylomarinum sp. Ch1-1]
MRPKNIKSSIHGMALMLLLSSQALQAETVKVPLQLDFPLLRQLVVNQLFPGEDVSTELLNDPNGCSSIVLSEPKLSEANQHLQILSRLDVSLAVKMLDRCVKLLDWQGYAQIISDPAIAPDNPRLLYLRVLDSHLISLDNERLSSGPIWDQARKQIHPWFKRFRLDLTSSIEELQDVLPLFLPRHTHAQLDSLLASLQIADLQVAANGIRGDLMFQLAPISLPQQPERPLTEQEQEQWQQKWQSMDALLTYAIKHYAAATELEELRLALFDILLDARYQLQEALQQNQTDDPLRHWFIDSWTRLIPVLQQISAKNPKHATLGLMTLVTASDALRTLDKLGPRFGLTISVDGLRRLARMLNHDREGAPLNYDQAEDPELLRLFRFPKAADVRGETAFDLWPIGSAQAAATRPLNRWVPADDELAAYLLTVRDLLRDKALSASANNGSLTSAQQAVFRKLLMATAWQESCWRQYVVKQKKSSRYAPTLVIPASCKLTKESGADSSTNTNCAGILTTTSTPAAEYCSTT